jgi:hypothetical protein
MFVFVVSSSFRRTFRRPPGAESPGGLATMARTNGRAATRAEHKPAKRLTLQRIRTAVAESRS